jgi:hypothetical protein
VLVHRLDDPPRFALLVENEAQSGIVGQTPEGEVNGEEPAGGGEGEGEEEDELEGEEGEGEDVDVLLYKEREGSARQAAVGQR